MKLRAADSADAIVDGLRRVLSLATQTPTRQPRPCRTPRDQLVVITYESGLVKPRP
jgi:hypothetical protein